MIETLKRINLMEFMTVCWRTVFTRENGRFLAKSPFREEKTASMYVNREKDGHWVYYDHGGEGGGSIIDAVMAYDGHKDVGLAIRTAKRMAEEAGLLGREPEEPGSESPKPNLEALFVKFCGNDTEPARRYLVERGIAPELVEDLITRRIVLGNRLNGSDYCCFAVRDGKGRLHSFFNRKINGSAKREKFLLGEQHVFCTDWTKVSEARRVTVCEAIIDALSVVTLDAGACVLAVPGARAGMGLLPDFQPDACLVDAFDADEAGRAAAKSLRKHYPSHTMVKLDLQGFHDVNERLCSPNRKDAFRPKLDLQDRIDIVMSSETSRTLAKKYAVHHSRICAIRNDGAEILRDVLSQRRVGRKANPVPSSEEEALRQERDAIQSENEELRMRVKWLELEVGIEKKRVVEAAAKSRTRKKKRLKRQIK